MEMSGPKKGQGWEGFLEDNDDVWYDAFETEEVGGNEVVDIDAYDEFENIQELVNFVVGTGTYEDTQSFEPDENDMERQKRHMKQENGPQCPSCLEELEEYLESGAMRTEVDIDPYMDIETWVNEEEANYHNDKDIKMTGHMLAYCDNDEHRANSHLGFSKTWYENTDE